MRLLAKPYSAYVGRSTTPLRALLALLVANLVVPLLITGTIFIPAWLTGNADWDTWSANAQQFQSVWLIGFMVAAPFLWIIGGVIWMVAHGIHQNGPIAALLAGSGATFICGAFITLLASGGSDSSLAGAFSGFVLLAALSAFGALGAAIVWIIAYKGRPGRRSYGMEKP